jgi:hypothetical protein
MPRNSGKTSYETDIRLGERYIDKQTGIEGTATTVTFFQHGCERVSLETVVKGEIKEYGFDSPRLTHVETQQQATSTRTGGPERGVSGRRPGAVTR